jgi:hypothetical protein
MAKLSISRAWEETQDVLARDGRLLASVALALVFAPAGGKGERCGDEERGAHQ